MNKCQLFTHTQHGYLRERSTTTAIFQFTQTILDHLENKQLALGMFLDLYKAYDCIDRDLLLFKLNRYGIRGSAYEWIRSYLSNRRQRVVVQEGNRQVKSDIQRSSVGIAQGSVLGPILFIIFLNDLNEIVQNFTITSYADDTNLLVPGLDMHDIVSKAEVAYNRTISWFLQNKLVLNDHKSKLILFRTKQKIEKPDKMNLNETNLMLDSSTTFLGVTIEEFLSWSNHIDVLCLKLSRLGYGIKIVANYMNLNTSKILYHANFEAVMRYGILFWGSSSDLQRVFIIQKRLVRTINKMNFLESCRVYALYVYECLMFLFRNREKFEMVNSSRTNNLLYPRHRLTVTEKSPYYVYLFNKRLHHFYKIYNMFNIK